MPNMATAVTAIYRYPVKGLSAEKMDRVALMPGECLPHDRRFAIALGSTPFDPERPGWLSKTHFIMLMRDEKLAQLQTRFDAEKGVLTIADNGRVLLLAPMTEPAAMNSSALKKACVMRWNRPAPYAPTLTPMIM